MTNCFSTLEWLKLKTMNILYQELQPTAERKKFSSYHIKNFLDNFFSNTFNEIEKKFLYTVGENIGYEESNFISSDTRIGDPEIIRFLYCVETSSYYALVIILFKEAFSTWFSKNPIIFYSAY